MSPWGIETTIAVAAITLCIATDNHFLVALCMQVIGLGMYAGEPLILAEAAEAVRNEHSGVVDSVVLKVHSIVSGFTYPYILGLVKDATGQLHRRIRGDHRLDDRSVRRIAAVIEEAESAVVDNSITLYRSVRGEYANLAKLTARTHVLNHRCRAMVA